MTNWARKPCSRCGGPKPSGRCRHVCDECQTTLPTVNRREWFRRHPESKLLASARTNAWVKGLECTLTKEHLFVPDHCPVLGIPLFFTPGKRTYNTPTVDRVDSTKGYTPENVVVVSWRANDLKKDATLTELRMLAAFYARRT